MCMCIYISFYLAIISKLQKCCRNGNSTQNVIGPFLHNFVNIMPHLLYLLLSL